MLDPRTPRPCAPQMFGGWVRKYKHQSAELGCEMVFSVFFPPAAAVQGAKVPVRWRAVRAADEATHAWM